MKSSGMQCHAIWQIFTDVSGESAASRCSYPATKEVGVVVIPYLIE
jgi:hypothetical protein